MSKRISRSTQFNHKPIEFSDISYNSTCITLNLSSSLACVIYQREMDSHTRRGISKNIVERQKSTPCQCEQHWLSKWVDNSNSTSGQAIKYNKVCAYLGIKSDTTLKFKCTYDKDKRVITQVVPPFQI